MMLKPCVCWDAVVQWLEIAVKMCLLTDKGHHESVQCWDKRQDHYIESVFFSSAHPPPPLMIDRCAGALNVSPPLPYVYVKCCVAKTIKAFIGIIKKVKKKRREEVSGEKQPLLSMSFLTSARFEILSRSWNSTILLQFVGKTKISICLLQENAIFS